jgi:hypothetical protein
MPRLVGKRSNNGASLGLLLIAAVAAYGVLEYSGTVDLIPHVGQNNYQDNYQGNYQDNYQGNSVMPVQ